MSWLWRAAPLLLAATVFFWAGNSVAGRALAGAVSPVTLAFWRWSLALLLITPLAWPRVKADAAELRRCWRTVVALSLTGIVSFSLLLYFGLQQTTALNSVLLQAAIPPLVLLFGAVALKDRTPLAQWLATAVSLAGVAVVITRGRPWDLLGLSLNAGDALVLAGVVLYAVYSLLLRRRPAVHPLSLLWVTFACATAVLAPVYLAQLALHPPGAPSLRALAGVGYIVVFPSFVAYLCFNRGVELVGPARASQYMHLQPIFGAALAVALLGEHVHPFHAVGLTLILGGLAIANFAARATPPAARPGESRDPG